MTDWLDSGWDLAGAYPTLPRIMTNAATAKKRRHKELFVTEAALDRPVRLHHEGEIARASRSGPAQCPWSPRPACADGHIDAWGVRRQATKPLQNS